MTLDDRCEIGRFPHAYPRRPLKNVGSLAMRRIANDDFILTADRGGTALGRETKEAMLTAWITLRMS